MKLRCRPEGRPECWTIAPADMRDFANWYFSEHESVHNMKVGGPLAVGCDWDKDAVLRLIDKVVAQPYDNEDDRWLGWAVVLDDQASMKGHHVVCATEGALDVFDFGIISEDQLDIDTPPPATPAWQDRLLDVEPPAPSQGWSTIYFYAAATSGEAGELLNKVKKHWRGDYNADNTERADELYDRWVAEVMDEIADVAVYLARLADHLGTTVDECVAHKAPELIARGYMTPDQQDTP